MRGIEHREWLRYGMKLDQASELRIIDEHESRQMLEFLTNSPTVNGIPHGVDFGFFTLAWLFFFWSAPWPFSCWCRVADMGRRAWSAWCMM